MAEGSTPTSQPTIFEARAIWSALVAMGEAAIALKQGSETMLVAFGSTTAAASAYVLYEAAGGLVRELGQQFRSLAASPDPEVRRFCTMLLDRLHAAPATEPSKESK